MDLAAVAGLLADPRRCAILLALGDGRALPAGRLAAEAGVSASTTSSHLRRLTDGGLLRVEQHGRHRYYRLAGEGVGRLLETVAQLSPQAPVRSLRQSGRARALHEARTCYDHLAGRLGVELMAALLDDGHLTGGDGRYDPQQAVRDRPVGHGHDTSYRLTRTGHDLLDSIGAGHERAVRYCVDWSEQRHHLAGPVGRQLLARLHTLDWVRPDAASRALRITEIGHAGLARTFRTWPRQDCA